MSWFGGMILVYQDELIKLCYFHEVDFLTGCLNPTFHRQSLCPSEN